MSKHVIAIEIDKTRLASYTDEYLAVCWHAAQHNPAPYGDYHAGHLTESAGREIIRRWLATVPPELWHHKGKAHYHAALSGLARYVPPPGTGTGSADFHDGTWELKEPPAAAPEEQ